MDATSASNSSAQPMTLEQQKARQRLHVKRSYYRKLNRMQVMRQQVETLKEKYMSALQAQEQSEPADKATSATAVAVHTLHHQCTEGDESKTHALAAYNTLTRLKERLRSENAMLEQQVEECETLAIKLTRFTAELDEDKTDTKDPRFQTSYQTPILIDRMTTSECHELGRRIYADISRFQWHNNYLTTGASVFGWRDRRRVEGDRLKYSLKKIFRGISPLHLSSRAWGLFTSEKRVARLYTPAVNPQFRRVQEVDENNFVMHRVVHSPAGNSMARSLYLLTRFVITNGFMIVFRSIDMKRLLTPPLELQAHDLNNQITEYWLDMFSWIRFEAPNEKNEHCHVDFSGIIPNMMVGTAEWWMMELLFSTLRWETEVHGSIFTLTE